MRKSKPAAVYTLMPLTAVLAASLCLAGCASERPAPEAAQSSLKADSPASDSSHTPDGDRAKPDYEAPNIDQSRARHRRTSNPVQPKSPDLSRGTPEHWVYADTHSHPYEGQLVSYRMDGDRLVSLDFKPTAALITSTNPANIITIGSENLNKVSTFPVRNDPDELAALDDRQLRHLKAGGPYIVYLDSWSSGSDSSVIATQVSTIYYAEDGEFHSLADDSTFDICTGVSNECLKLTK